MEVDLGAPLPCAPPPPCAISATGLAVLLLVVLLLLLVRPFLCHAGRKRSPARRRPHKGSAKGRCGAELTPGAALGRESLSRRLRTSSSSRAGRFQRSHENSTSDSTMATVTCVQVSFIHGKTVGSARTAWRGTNGRGISICIC